MKLNYGSPIFTDKFRVIVAIIVSASQAEMDRLDNEMSNMQQIAEPLRIPQNTAASRYRYGLDKLRQRLRPLYDEIK